MGYFSKPNLLLQMIAVSGATYSVIFVDKIINVYVTFELCLLKIIKFS